MSHHLTCTIICLTEKLELTLIKLKFMLVLRFMQIIIREDDVLHKLFEFVYRHRIEHYLHLNIVLFSLKSCGRLYIRNCLSYRFHMEECMLLAKLYVNFSYNDNIT